MPLLDDVNYNLYPNSDITLIVHADWWADNMRERLDFGTFKRVIMKKFGKDDETFAHYFITKMKNQKHGWYLSKNRSERLTKGLPPFCL